MLNDVIESYGGEKVDPLDVYKDIFRIGEGFIQKEYEDSESFKANPIAYYKNENEDHGHFRIMFEDKFEEIYQNELVNADFCVMNGIKCGLSKDEIKQDAIDLIPFLNGLNEKEPFTEEDIKSALECYDERYNTFPLKDIEKLTNIRIERNKRNGRKQDQHLKIARFTRDLNYDDPNGWINKEGAPTKQSIVQKWRLEHPEGKKADCIRDTGLTKPTVYKWWNI